MKYKILALALIITTVAAAQENFKCMPFENISNWTQLYEIPIDSLQRIANSPMHFHSWQYEDKGDKEDINILWNDLVHREVDCGYSTTTKERRICEVCTMFEERTITKGLEAVYFTTPFDYLKQKYYKQHNPQSVYERMWKGYSTTTSDTIRMSDLIKYLPNDHK